VLPIYWNQRAKEKQDVLGAAQRAADALRGAGLDVAVDEGDKYTPGQKVRPRRQRLGWGAGRGLWGLCLLGCPATEGLGAPGLAAGGGAPGQVAKGGAAAAGGGSAACGVRVAADGSPGGEAACYAVVPSPALCKSGMHLRCCCPSP
jgi:hypothetical protein